MPRSATFTLKKEQRLKSRKRIQQLFREGKSFQIYPYTLYYILDTVGDHTLQAGFGVSTRLFKKATDRNRIKRLTREGYRTQCLALKEKLAANQLNLSVFFIYNGKELPTFEIVSKKSGSILDRLTRIIDEKIGVRN
jgi:ribonuclease P protein component